MPSEPVPVTRSNRVPLGKRVGQVALIFTGSTVTICAIANGAAAWWLIQSSDEEFLGITRRDVLIWCAALFVLGTLLLYLGIRSWRRTRAARSK